MADFISKKKRSKIMSSIKGKWTRPERAVHSYLKGRKIRHKMHPRIEGNPDIVLSDKKVAIFLDGCFWHRCPKCYRAPTSNVDYWIPKIKENMRRDRKNTRLLKRKGYKVVRIWEHELADMRKVLSKIENA